MRDDLLIGQEVWYVLARGAGRERPLYWTAKIVNLTAKRVVIRLRGSVHVRAVDPLSISTTPPPEAADVR